MEGDNRVFLYVDLGFWVWIAGGLGEGRRKREEPHLPCLTEQAILAQA